MYVILLCCVIMLYTDFAKIKCMHFCDGGAQNLLKQELYMKLTYIAHLFTITNFLMVMSVFFIFCYQNAEFDVSQSSILSELGMYISDIGRYGWGTRNRT